MNSIKREQLIADLKAFYEDLKDYRNFKEKENASTAWVTRDKKGGEALRKKLVRQAGSLKPIVVGLTDKQLATAGGATFDVWTEALGKNATYALSALDMLSDAVIEAIGKLESKYTEEIISLRKLARARPKILISHGGETPLRKELELFLWKTDCEPIVIEDVARADQNPDQKFNAELADADFCIVLVEKERTSEQDGKLLPRGNVIDEIERIRLTLKDRFIVLLEEGVELPSNLQTSVTWEPFSAQNFDSALLAVMRYLRQHDVL